MLFGIALLARLHADLLSSACVCWRYINNVLYTFYMDIDHYLVEQYTGGKELATILHSAPVLVNLFCAISDCTLSIYTYKYISFLKVFMANV